MSTYTTQLSTIINQATQHRDDLSIDQRIEIGRQHLFDFDYPMFDDRYKPVFERHFIENFYDREIGFETEFLFKRRLKNWLQLNMGYYSKLFESETLKFDPFINSKVDVTHTKKNDETSKTDKNYGETNSRDISDFTVTDEDTTKDTEKGVTGSTTDDTQTQVDTSVTSDTDTTLDGNTDTTMESKTNGETTYNTDTTKDIDTDNRTESDMTGNTTGTTDGTSNTNENTTSNESTDSTREEDEFDRNLHSDTPDSRLSITVNGTDNSISGDGEGSAGYASDITEKRGFENEKSNSNTNASSDTKTDTTTHDETSTDSTQNQVTTETGSQDEVTNESERGTSSDTTTGSENESKTESGTEKTTGTTSETGTKNEQGTTTEDTEIAEKGTKDETVDRTIGESGKRDFDEVVDGNINSLEDFIQHRVGKIGVQTYSKMLMEFRDTFLRVERECFEEIESRLFMLVY